MNLLDMVIIACAIAGFVHGLFTGIIKQVISLVSLVIAILLSGTIAKIINHWVELHLRNVNEHLSSSIQGIIYYIVAFVLIISLFAVAAKLVDSIINHTPVGLINRFSGALFGGFLWLICLSMALNFVSLFDSQSRLIKKPLKEHSICYEPVRMLFPTVFPYIKETFKK